MRRRERLGLFLLLRITSCVVDAFLVPQQQTTLQLQVPQSTVSTGSSIDNLASSDVFPSSSSFDLLHQDHVPPIVSTLVSHESTTTFVVDPWLPALGSASIMLTIVALLYAWEKSVEWTRETVPKDLLPVVESILGEIGGLGFIGLVLQTVVLRQGSNKEFLEEWSVRIFGEGEILVETFEFLHSAFFQVGIGFFVAAGVMVAVGLQKLREVDEIEELQVDLQTGACSVTPEQLANYLPVLTDETCLDQPPRVDGVSTLMDEIFMSSGERAGKSLLLRNQVVEKYNLDDTFRVEQYIRGSFATNLLEMVELSPLTWVWLIPALALANSVDLQHEAINASSPNAAESVGFFFSTPWVFVPSLVSVALSLVWGTWNCWKLTLIKYMALPRLGRVSENQKAQILPPPLEFASAVKSFGPLSSPAWVQPIEALWSEPPTTPFEEVFGTAGASGLELYRNSVKFQTWLCITHVVFFGTQIVPRDLDAMFSSDTLLVVVGDPDHLTAELVAYGGFVLLSLLQLVLIAPRSFWNLCLVECLGDKKHVCKLLSESML